MEVRLLQLEIEGFRSFKRKATFVFPEGDGIILIDGKWKGAPTRSGSGKTTLLEALAFLLDISSGTLASLKNWDSKKMLVKGKFLVGKQVVDIIKDPKLSLVIDGEPYNSLQKGAKEHLQTLFGGNPEIIKSITYRRQRKPGKIVNSTDAQIKDFLTDPLGLKEVEAAADTFNAQANKISISLELLKRDEQNLASTIHMNFVSEEEATKARQTYDAAKIQYESLVTQSGTAELQARSSQLSAEIQSANQVAYTVSTKSNENDNMRNAIIQLQAEIAHLEKSVCHTCQRQWDKAKEVLTEKNSSIDKYVTQMRTNIEYINNATPIVQNLNNLQVLLSEVQRKIGEASAPAHMARQTLDSTTYALNMLQNKYGNYAKQTGQLDKLRADIAAQERELLIVDTTAKLLGRGGFMGSIFDEILADIEVRTNDMLQNFPNAEQFTVQISSNRLVKTKGTTKKEISVTISRSGTDVGYEDLSGGQQSAIELCTDLAYGESVRARSGCSLRWTCLDEVMDGLGPSEKEAVVNMIRKRVKGLVLMIEHATEIRESFDKVIGIEYDGRESYVTTA